MRILRETEEYSWEPELPHTLSALGSRLTSGGVHPKGTNLTAWEAASDLVRGWDASGQIGVVRVEIPTIKEAAQKYIADGEARNLNSESLKKMRDAVERLLTKYRDLASLGSSPARMYLSGAKHCLRHN
jgi:hypothetical protein